MLMLLVSGESRTGYGGERRNYNPMSSFGDREYAGGEDTLERLIDGTDRSRSWIPSRSAPASYQTALHCTSREPIIRRNRRRY